MREKKTFTAVRMDNDVIDQMKINRDKMNPMWPLGKYLEYVVATHTQVLRLKEEQNAHRDDTDIQEVR